MINNKHIVILGGGTAGLVAARTIANKKNISSKITIVEAQSKLGGWISSQRCGKTGVLFEQGPHSLRPRSSGNGLQLVQLIHSLLLQAHDNKNKQILCASSSDRLIWKDNQLILLPSKLMDVFKNPFTRRLPLEIIREALFSYSPTNNSSNAVVTDDSDETIHAFFSKHFSTRTADEFISAIVAGIFAGDTRSLSVKSCFPDFYNLTQTGYGSLVRGLLVSSFNTNNNNTKTIVQDLKKSSPIVNNILNSSSFTFSNGLADFIELLQDNIRSEFPNVDIELNEQVIKLQPTKGKQWIITTNSGREIQCSDVISTLGIPNLTSCLEDSSSGNYYFSYMNDLKQLNQHLNPAVHVAVVNLAYRNETPTQPGFGHLVSSINEIQKYGTLGILYDSIVFPQQQPKEFTSSTTGNGGGCVLSVMLGGAHAGKWISSLTQDQIISLATDAVHRHLKFSSLPVTSCCSLHLHCIPQYLVGHSNIANTMKQQVMKDYNLLILGTGMNGVGLADAVGSTVKDVERYIIM
jgi:oxygen-dependent protoporphyrinogen oxidase